MIRPWFMEKAKALWYCRQSDEFLSQKLKEVQQFAIKSRDNADKADEMAHFLAHQIAERVTRRVYQMNKEDRAATKARIEALAAEMDARREEYAE